MTIDKDVVVIGGGQAGLAIGRLLVDRGRDIAILDAAAETAAAWRARWESLRLFTPARHDALPGRPFPGHPDRYPTRDDVIAYLTEYARDLPVELDSRVLGLRREDDAYRVELADRSYRAGQVVIATGPFQAPRVPAFARALDPRVRSLHSADYRRPSDLPDGRVLVVGGGNTGFQIAAELAATREAHLAVGSRQPSVPQRPLGRDLFAWLDRLGLMERTVDSRIGRRMRDRDVLVGSSPRAARRGGIALHGRVVGVAGRAVRFADGTELTVDGILWATGFGMDHSWIDVPGALGADGRPSHVRGVTPASGLCFLGLPWQHTRGSALLGWVGRDAEHLAVTLDAQAGVRARA